MAELTLKEFEDSLLERAKTASFPHEAYYIADILEEIENFKKEKNG